MNILASTIIVALICLGLPLLISFLVYKYMKTECYHARQERKKKLLDEKIQLKMKEAPYDYLIPQNLFASLVAVVICIFLTYEAFNVAKNYLINLVILFPVYYLFFLQLLITVSRIKLYCIHQKAYKNGKKIDGEIIYIKSHMHDNCDRLIDYNYNYVIKYINPQTNEECLFYTPIIDFYKEYLGSEKVSVFIYKGHEFACEFKYCKETNIFPRIEEIPKNVISNTKIKQEKIPWLLALIFSLLFLFTLWYYMFLIKLI